MAIPLNLSRFIPEGLYCYKVLSFSKDKEYGFKMKVKNCMFYQHKKESCWLMSGEEVDDQCKICGINDYMRNCLLTKT
jgi:hypothetical protein